MLQTLMKLILGSKNDRFIKHVTPIINTINGYETPFSRLSDLELQQKIPQFKSRLEQGETLEQILPECFAVVREASKRTIGLRHHDVQLIGGIALHRGNISEMATGEGKTLVATLPVVLNALTGKGVHVVTVNSYLAERDATWMGKIYQYLGLSVGIIGPEMSQQARANAYACDITYANNNELGFDYLRDNMVSNRTQVVQRKPYFAIIDEVDSILIDEARTPLIISGPVGQSSELYTKIYPLIDQLTGTEDAECSQSDVHINIKERLVQLTEHGHEKVETLLQTHQLINPGDNLYSAQNAMLLHYVEACMHAKFLFKRDTHYIVKDGEAIIIDEHTGRTLKGRRWSRGHHQATEAKEGLNIQQETQTLASITFQNYFKLYEKIAGMTGTADTEAEELEAIYKLQVIVIPTHKTCQRVDHNDIIYMNKFEKYKAIVNEIETRHKKSQPVLVGTTSIEDSEYLSGLLKAQSIPHSVLNAKQHAREADIIAEAGEPGKVTIATNMAGRGTDIILGGKWDRNLNAYELKDPSKVQKAKATWEAKHQAVLEAGGLHVLGTERHESRRVDNQLRGRCARQGDPGSSQFFLSLEDHLFRIFPQGVLNFIKNSSQDPSESLQAGMLNHAISTNQKKMESHYFDIRKQLLKYDDIANDQRQNLYRQRRDLLSRSSIQDKIEGIFHKCFENTLQLLHKDLNGKPYDPERIIDMLNKLFPHSPSKQTLENAEHIPTAVAKHYYEHYIAQIAVVNQSQRNELEKGLFLQIIDHHWKEHLLLMEDLRESIGLKGYAQKNPEQEYKLEAHAMFETMFSKAQYDFVMQLARLQIQTEPAEEHLEKTPSQSTAPSEPSSLAKAQEGVRMATPLD